MIKKLFATNFKPFEKLDIDLSKINLFFGPNNSGKSSILSILTLLTQTLNSTDSNVSLLLGGSNTIEDYGTYRDLIYNHDINSDLEIGIGTEFVHPGKKSKPEKQRVDINLKYGYRQKRHEVLLKNITVNFQNDNLELCFERAKSYNSSQYYFLPKSQELRRIRVAYMDHFLPHVWSRKLDKSFLLRTFIREFYYSISSIEYIGPFREPARRTYMFSGENPRTVGVHGERAVDIMTMDHLKQKGKDKKNIVDKISDWFKASQISEGIDIRTLTDRHFEVIMSHINSKSEENIADSGSGCSQVLPILVSGYNASDGDILIIQEPEIHLHPKAQAELGSFFYQLSQKGIQTIIETHSEHLLLRLQAHLASNNTKLKPDDIKIYYVYVDNEGKTKVININLKENGYFSEEWPGGFFPERLGEAKKIAKRSL